MNVKAKLRPFYVVKVIYEQTDEDLYLTMAWIMEQFENDYGILTSCRTIGDNITILQELGIGIAVEPYTQKWFYMIGLKFDFSELRLWLMPWSQCGLS